MNLVEISEFSLAEPATRKPRDESSFPFLLGERGRAEAEERGKFGELLGEDLGFSDREPESKRGREESKDRRRRRRRRRRRELDPRDSQREGKVSSRTCCSII
jgi:hypothetical protein